MHVELRRRLPPVLRATGLAAVVLAPLAAGSAAAQSAAPPPPPSKVQPVASAPAAVPRISVVNLRLRAHPSTKPFHGLVETEFVKVKPKGRAEAFRTDRAVLRLPAGVDPTALLKQHRLEPLEPLRSPTPRATPAPYVQQQAPLARPRGERGNEIFVKLPAALLSLPQAELAVQAKFGGEVQFSSERAARVMGFILSVNEGLKKRKGKAGLSLVPDFLMAPAQMLTPDTAREGPGVTPPATDAYWENMQVWRAWQLAQVANPTSSKDLWIAIVDQGFVADPQGMSWDAVRSIDGKLGRQNDDPRVPWHGTNVASTLNAAVNDEVGAAGAALWGAGSLVRSSKPRNIKTMAVELPAGSNGSFTAIANAIQSAVLTEPRARFINVSYAGVCGEACQADYGGKGGDQAITDALLKAKEKQAIVLFAAGNDGINLEDAGVHYPGCESAGALCVGGIMRENTRWTDIEGGTDAGSNYGPAVSVWGPAFAVWVGPDGDGGAHRVSGTSVSAPFVAGVLALAESSWGKTLNLDQWKGVLNPTSGAKPDTVITPSTGFFVLPGILNAYELLRREVQIAPDRTEAVNNANGGEPLPDELYTLHTPQDVDRLPIDAAACEIIRVRTDYLEDNRRGVFHAKLLSPDSATPIELSGGAGTISTAVQVCKGQHQLEVSQVSGSGGGLTTGYSVQLVHEASECPENCTPTVVPEVRIVQIDPCTGKPVEPRPAGAGIRPSKRK